jgi:hypothetical protein
MPDALRHIRDLADSSPRLFVIFPAFGPRSALPGCLKLHGFVGFFLRAFIGSLLIFCGTPPPRWLTLPTIACPRAYRARSRARCHRGAAGAVWGRTAWRDGCLHPFAPASLSETAGPSHYRKLPTSRYRRRWRCRPRLTIRGVRALVRLLAFSISARSTGFGGGLFASLSAKACPSAVARLTVQRH